MLPRSPELALHRWDLDGADAIGERLLAQPELTAHAITVLSTMTSLQESVAVRASKLTGAPDGFAFRLRSPGSDDVLVRLNPKPALELQAPADSADDPPVIRTAAADRLLMLWGRQPPGDRVDMSGVPAATARLVKAFLRV